MFGCVDHKSQIFFFGTESYFERYKPENLVTDDFSNQFKIY